MGTPAGKGLECSLVNPEILCYILIGGIGEDSHLGSSPVGLLQETDDIVPVGNVYNFSIFREPATPWMRELVKDNHVIDVIRQRPLWSFGREYFPKRTTKVMCNLPLGGVGDKDYITTACTYSR